MIKINNMTIRSAFSILIKDNDKSKNRTIRSAFSIINNYFVLSNFLIFLLI